MWDLFIIVLAIYNSVQVPVKFVFGDKLQTFKLGYLDDVAEFAFLIDIVITFFTTYINKNGKVETELTKIAKNYM